MWLMLKRSLDKFDEIVNPKWLTDGELPLAYAFIGAVIYRVPCGDYVVLFLDGTRALKTERK